MNRKALLGILALLGLAGCAGQAKKTIDRRKRIIAQPGIETPDDDDGTIDADMAPFIDAVNGPILDPNLEETKEELKPKAPAYFYFIDGDDPTGRLLKALKTACQRWSKATGVRIEVGRGSRIGLASGAETEHTVCWWPRNDAPLDGASGRALRDNWMATQVYIADDSNAGDVGLANLLTHELGHSLGRRGDHITTGIMAPGFSSFDVTPIDDASLTYVCEYLICPVFNPEG